MVLLDKIAGYICDEIVEPSFSNLTNKINENITRHLQSISDKFDRNYETVTITTKFGNYAYFNLMNLLKELNPRKYEKHSVPAWNNRTYLEDGTKYVVRINEENSYSVYAFNRDFHAQTEYCCKLTFIGPNARKYKEKVMNLLFELMNSSKMIDVVVVGADGIGRSFYIAKRNYETLVLDKEVKDRIFNGIKNWRKSKDWYFNHGLPHKLGILLYGPPGSGKSSIGRAIASTVGKSRLYMISPESIKEGIESIVSDRSEASEIETSVCVVFIEDIDRIMKNDINSSEVNDDKGDSKFTLYYLLQLLDGIFSTNNTIYIATTNNVDLLDPALIRAGRFDIQEKIDYFGEELTKEFLGNYGYQINEIEEMIGEKIQYPVSPAYLQSVIMGLRAKKGGKS